VAVMAATRILSPSATAKKLQLRKKLFPCTARKILRNAGIVTLKRPFQPS
jgi:hypothetical protein